MAFVQRPLRSIGAVLFISGLLAFSSASAQSSDGDLAATTTTATAPLPCQRELALTATEQPWQGTGKRRVQNRYRLSGKSGFWFTSGMTIDADGSPRAFHRVSAMGLDDLANAGRPGNWWGILTNNGQTNGRPVVQGRNDPAPGFYISQTGLEDTSKKMRDPRRYVDAEKVPYVVLSGNSRQNFRAKFGDYVVAYNTLNDKYTYAMYGDNWPQLKIGEGSIALAKELEIDADPRAGGVEDATVVYLVFPNSRTTVWRSEESNESLKAAAESQFAAWGGIDQLRACSRL
jgi:Fungal chitosanase of glycosyl hydrolase group 75